MSRFLSLWFPRLAAELWQRQRRLTAPLPLAILRSEGGMEVLASLNGAASRAGLFPGQNLRDALALCPPLQAKLVPPQAEAAALAVLGRWAGRFSPRVAESPPGDLTLDITGAAHLFGGEAALWARLEAAAGRMGLTLCLGLADTPKAAWALAHYGAGWRAGADLPPGRSGDDIAQEARATRARAAKRRGWEKGGGAPTFGAGGGLGGGCALPGQTRQALAPLPLAALCLPQKVQEGLARLGLRRIGDLAGLPRGPLARRFGHEVWARLDAALGLRPDPLTPRVADPPLAVRLSFPEPIARAEDLAAACGRLLPVLCEKLRGRGLAARRLRLEARMSDGGLQAVELGLAMPMEAPERIAPLLALKLPALMEKAFGPAAEGAVGMDYLRLLVLRAERREQGQKAWPVRAAAAGGEPAGPRSEGLADLITRLSARLGEGQVLYALPGESHLPEQGAQFWDARFDPPGGHRPWAAPALPRPLQIFSPERIALLEEVAEGAGGEAFPSETYPPARFRWRGQVWRLRQGAGPERIAPEWWLDRPEWQSGPRDYWRVELEGGARLWLFWAHGGLRDGGWFCQGLFP